MTPRWTLMARRFYEQALVDLDSARENVRPRRYHNAVLFAQQAAEKALKAAYWHLVAERNRRGSMPWSQLSPEWPIWWEACLTQFAMR